MEESIYGRPNHCSRTKHGASDSHNECGSRRVQVLVPARRDAMTNMINNGICVNGMDKARLSQDLALYNLALSEQIPNVNGTVHKETWLNDPVWFGLRENVERLTATPDWAEQIFATNIIFDPLCGELFRIPLVLQFA